MAQNKEDFTFTLTSPVRMIFVNLLTPKAFKAGAEPKYSATFLIPNASPDLPGLKAMIASVYKAAFPGQNLEASRLPLKNGDTQADKAKAKGKDLEVARGHWTLGTNSGYRPVLSVVANGSVIDLTDDALIARYGAQFYAGVEAYGAVFFKDYSITETNWGVTAYLQNVLSTNKGDKIGAASGASRFAHYAGHLSSVNPETAQDEKAWA